MREEGVREEIEKIVEKLVIGVLEDAADAGASLYDRLSIVVGAFTKEKRRELIDRLRARGVSKEYRNSELTPLELAIAREVASMLAEEAVAVETGKKRLTDAMRELFGNKYRAVTRVAWRRGSGLQDASGNAIA